MEHNDRRYPAILRSPSAAVASGWGPEEGMHGRAEVVAARVTYGEGTATQ